MPCCEEEKCGGYVSFFYRKFSKNKYCARHIFESQNGNGNTEYSCGLQRWSKSNWEFYKRVGKDSGIILAITLFIIDFIQRVFSITDSFICRKLFHKPTISAVRIKYIDRFVLVMLGFSGSVYLLYFIFFRILNARHWISIVLILLIMFFRIFPILTIHLGTMLFSKHFERPERNIVLAILNYVECIFWFGILYLAIGNQFNPCLNNHWSSALYYSMITITTLGYGDIKPTGGLARLTSGFEAIIGVFFIALVIGYFLSHLSDIER